MTPGRRFTRMILLVACLLAVAGCSRKTDPRAQEGYDLVVANKIDEAIAYANAILADEPDNSSLRNVLGMALYKAGDIEASVVQYKRALESDESNAEAWFNLGNAQNALGREEDALESFQTALRIQGDFVLARYNVGKYHEKRGRMEPALAAYRRCVEDDPQYVFAFIDIGKILYESGDYEGAVRNLSRALELDPGIKQIRVLLGNAYLQSGRENKVQLAENEYRAAVGLDESYPDAVYSLGVSLAMQNREEEAVEWFEKLLAILEAREKHDHEAMAQKVRAYFQEVGYQPGAGFAPGAEDTSAG